MFDSVLDRGNIPKRQLGSGGAASIGVYAVVIALGVWIGSRPIVKQKEDTEVKFMAAAPPAPPPPPPALLGGGAQQKVQPKKPPPVKKPDTIVETKDDKPPPPPKVDDTPAPASTNTDAPPGPGVPSGIPGGDPRSTCVGPGCTGKVGSDPATWGSPGSTGTAPVNQVYTFGAGMTRPVSLSGSPPYTPEARAARVEGKMLIKCVITKSGSATNCQVIKGLPFMDDAALRWLQSAKFSPVQLNGAAIDCSVTIPFTIKVP